MFGKIWSIYTDKQNLGVINNILKLTGIVYITEAQIHTKLFGKESDVGSYFSFKINSDNLSSIE